MSDWRAITDEREKYNAYLCSREWALLRNAVRNRCGGLCERCGVNAMECVHHLTYARKYREQLEDLAGWCNACHDFTHGKIDKDPKINWEQQFADLIRSQKEHRRYVDLYFFLLLGSQIFEHMGKEWLFRAANGEFKRNDTTDQELQEIVNRRRKQQGII